MHNDSSRSARFARSAAGRLWLCIAVFGGLLLASAQSAAASAAAAPTAEQVERYMYLSGTQRALQQLPRLVEESARVERERVPDPQAFDRLMQQVARRADGATLARRFGEHLRAHVDAQTLAEQIQWLESPDGRAVVAATLAALEPGRSLAKRDHLAALQAAPPNAARIELIQNIERASRSTELGLAMMAAAARGFAAVERALGVPLPSDAELEAAIAQHVAAQEAQTRGQMLLSHFYSLRDLSDELLARYYRFMSTPSSQRFIDIAGKGLVAQLSQLFVDAFAESRPPGT